MKHVIIPYTSISITAKGVQQPKVIFAPLLETFLYHQDRQTNFSFYSLVDSGADFCVFTSKFGEMIGLEVDQGEAIPTMGVGGIEVLYMYDIRVGVKILDDIWHFNCRAGFSKKMNKKGIGFLGRKGFFDLFAEISFNENKRMFKIKTELNSKELFFDY